MRNNIAHVAASFLRHVLAFLLLTSLGFTGHALAQAPSAPTGINPLGGGFPYYSSTVTLSWDPTPGATYYAIRANDQTQMSNRMPGNNCAGDPHYVCVDGWGGNSFQLAVQPGHYYDWWVHACNAYGCSGPSSGALATHVAPPANLSAQCAPDGNSVTLSWTPSQGATGYAPRFNYTNNDGGPGCQFNWYCSGDDSYGEQTSNVYSRSVVPGGSYSFWVHGMGPAGYGDASSTSFQCNPPAPTVSFPSFSTVRTDFINQYEGLWFSPMQIASPLCQYLPYTSWQAWLCTGSQSMPTTYPQTHAFSTASDPYFSWIIAMNNEFIQNPDCNTGPPNQSRAVNQVGSPFILNASASSLRLEVKHDVNTTCRKIPYMSAAYLRGVQTGDSMPHLLTWSQLQGKSLVLDVEITKQSAPVTWFRVLTHYRDANGTRYFINKDYVMPDSLATTYLNWNWPWRNSFQYPGAVIAIPERSPSFSLPNGRHTIVIPLATQWAQYFSTSAQPNFLGVEVAVEMGELGDGIAMEIRGISVQ
jgi:hypothetical protein